MGSLLRIVGAQSYFDRDKGNIGGKDLGSNARVCCGVIQRQLASGSKLAADRGVDNLLDRTYAEFVSRAAVMAWVAASRLRANVTRQRTWPDRLVKSAVELDGQF